jgi:hypothetical protein
VSVPRQRRAPSGLALVLAALGPAAGGVAAAQPANPSPTALHACAIISGDAARLACYDRLAGRSQDARAGSAAAAQPESFGLYPAEHPKPPPVASSLEARVTALGKDAAGRMTVSLEGGALWELDESDPLLAVGETVTITRAALGSFLLKTASSRTHRVRRLH